MKYLKAYITALAYTTLTTSLIYFLLHLIYETSLTNLYFVYLILASGLAGPLRVAIEESKK